MEIFSLHSPPPSVTRLSSSSWRRASMEKPASLFGGQLLSFPDNSKWRQECSRNSSSLDYRPRASGSTQIGTTPTMTKEPAKQETSSKDTDLAFVAGATGKVGSRTVRELLRLGFRVRASVRSTKRAETLVQSVRQMNVDDVTGSLGTQPVEKLEIVECDLLNQGSIGSAIGNASVVICCIGASEKEIFDITGPYRIDYKATQNLVEAASIAKVDHFILLTSLGTNKIGFPASILNLFWGVLFWKRKAEEALIASGLPYTIVRPGGMERPTDAYKETHNVVLANEDTYFGGQVSNLQVAELLAVMAKHRRLSFCKIVEVIAETTAPLTPIEELLATIPSQREQPEEPRPDPVPLSIESEPTGSVVKKDLGQVEASITKPLSPYAMYDDLKPPTSPTPTPPGTSKEKIAEPKPLSPENSTSSPPDGTVGKESVQESPQKSSHLSPYMAYDDLKPPTSPTPTPCSASNGISDAPVNSLPLLESNSQNDAVATISMEENEKEIPHIPPLSSSHQSSYYVFSYDDLKPPTSPSPSTPATESSISTSVGGSNSTPSVSEVSQVSVSEESGPEQQANQQTSRSLSPYTMYEDLKPPSSPVPSMPKY